MRDEVEARLREHTKKREAMIRGLEALWREYAELAGKDPSPAAFDKMIARKYNTDGRTAKQRGRDCLSNETAKVVREGLERAIKKLEGLKEEARNAMQAMR